MHNVSLLGVLVETKDIYCQYHVAIILRADINVFPVWAHVPYGKGAWCRRPAATSRARRRWCVYLWSGKACFSCWPAPARSAHEHRGDYVTNSATICSLPSLVLVITIWRMLFCCYLLCRNKWNILILLFLTHVFVIVLYRGGFVIFCSLCSGPSLGSYVLTSPTLTCNARVFKCDTVPESSRQIKGLNRPGDSGSVTLDLGVLEDCGEVGRNETEGIRWRMTWRIW